MYSSADRWNDYEQEYPGISGITVTSNYLDHHQQQINSITSLSSMTPHESGTLLSLDSDNNCSDYK